MLYIGQTFICNRQLRGFASESVYIMNTGQNYRSWQRLEVGYDISAAS